MLLFQLSDKNCHVQLQTLLIGAKTGMKKREKDIINIMIDADF